MAYLLCGFVLLGVCFRFEVGCVMGSFELRCYCLGVGLHRFLLLVALMSPLFGCLL